MKYNQIIKYIRLKCQNNKYTALILDYLSYLKRKVTLKIIDKNMLINVEGFTDYNIPIEWFYEKKEKGISGVARLKNADNFLEKCMESYLPFLDELILVDNMSDDKTRTICKKLLKKYPKKIKIYQYPYKVSPPSVGNMQIPTNSIHSLAYYYNRCFSKTKYSHVMKVDDDMLMLKEKCILIRNLALSKYKNRYNTYWGINLVKDGKGNYCTIKGQEYAGHCGDHGIYPVSPYAYYEQGLYREVLRHKLYTKRHGFAFFHLKRLKPNFGLHNLKDKKYKKMVYDMYIKDSTFTNFDKILPKEKIIKFTDYFKDI